MKEIKFRRAHFFDEQKTRFSHFTEWGVNIKDASFVCPSTNNYALYFIDLQYTGLKDKNGKEICEESIFMLSRINEPDEYLGTVKYDADLCAFVVHKSNGGWEYLPKFLLENKTAFVGGDAFQNPELLK